jgi:hypothetical protein
MNRQIAACGLDCGSCEILRVPTDPEATRSVTDWFRRMGWIGEGEGVEDVVRKAPYCLGCRGDRSVHWSSDCWILKCCVDDKVLDHCSECDEFPCEKLSEWSKKNEGYSRAFERMKRMRNES